MLSPFVRLTTSPLALLAISLTYTASPTLRAAVTPSSSPVPALASSPPDSSVSTVAHPVHLPDYSQYGPLWNAVAKGDTQAIEKLIANGADINSRNGRTGDFQGDIGMTPLLAAFDLEDRRPLNLALIQFLLDKGAKVNIRNEYHELPLELAIKRNSKETSKAVQLLIDKGANIDVFKGDGTTLLEWSVGLGQLDTVRALLAAGAKTQFSGRDPYGGIHTETAETVLEHAAASGNIEVARIFINRGAKVNSNGSNALNTAIILGHSSMVRFLLQSGANPNLAQRDSNTALHTALDARPIKPDIVDALLRDGANPNLNNGSGKLFAKLTDVGRLESLTIADKLIKAGARFNPKQEGVGLLHLSLLLGNDAFAQQMLNRGVNANSLVEIVGLTPLRTLAQFGSWKIATSAHEALGTPKTGASPEQLLNEAAERDTAIARILISKGAKTGAGFNRFALMDAAEAGNTSLVRLLLEHGAPVNISDREQLTLMAPGFARQEQREDAYAGKASKSGTIKKRLPKLTIKEVEAMYKTLIDAKAATPESASWNLHSAPFVEGFGLGTSPLGRTPLLAAAANGHAEIVRMLLKHGADVRARNRWGQTPLIAAADMGRGTLVRPLFFSRLIMAENLVSVKEGIARAGYEYELWELQGWKAEATYTPQEEQEWNQWAESGDTSVMKALLSAGSNVNAQDFRGQTALHYAARLGYTSQVALLIKARAKVNTVDKQGRTPLMQIAWNGRRSLNDRMAAPLLYDLKTQIALDIHDNSRLRNIATEHKAEHALDVRLEAQRRDIIRQMTNLRSRTVQADTEATRKLLNARARRDIKDNTGLTAQGWASKSKYPELVTILQARS